MRVTEEVNEETQTKHVTCEFELTQMPTVMRWSVPLAVNFEGLGLCFFQVLGYRGVRAGEFYLSGADVQAYRSKGGWTQRYLVVKPTYHAQRKTLYVYVKGERVCD